MKNLETLIGKFVNYYGYSDIKPVGRVIGVKGKSTLVLHEVTAELHPDYKPQYESGGFTAVCTNSIHQKWEFTEHPESLKEVRYSKGLLKVHKIEDNPKRFYDFNF